MEISQDLINHIKKYEGFRSHAYRNKGDKWTIGYGHTSGVKEGDVIDKEKAEKYLIDDINDAKEHLDRLSKVKLNPNQQNAMIDFIFNVGPYEVLKSTLLRMLNANNFEGAANQFERWIHNREGTILPGLVKRTAARRKMFETPYEDKK